MRAPRQRLLADNLDGGAVDADRADGIEPRGRVDDAAVDDHEVVDGRCLAGGRC